MLKELMPLVIWKPNSTRFSTAMIVSSLCLLGTWAHAELPDSQLTLGPPRGTLVIVGGRGGETDPESGEAVADLIFAEFVKLAGGREAQLVIVPTASTPDQLEDPETHKDVLRARKSLKMPHVSVLHTHSAEEANDPAKVRLLDEADAIWFTGGRQWRLAEVYLGTACEAAFKKLLDRGGVIGGSSAGATIQGSFLVRGDTSGNSVLIGDHQRGFGFLTNSAVDQHVIKRKRQNDLTTLLQDSQHQMLPEFDRASLLGIGIDEDSAVVIRGNQLEVIGKPSAQVLIYNPRAWTPDMKKPDRYTVLHLGDRYDLRERRPFPVSSSTTR